MPPEQEQERADRVDDHRGGEDPDGQGDRPAADAAERPPPEDDEQQPAQYEDSGADDSLHLPDLDAHGGLDATVHALLARQNPRRA